MAYRSQYHTRPQLIEMVAAITLGRDPNDPKRADVGWKGALSRQLGMGKNGVAEALAVEAPGNSRFDNRMADYIEKRRLEMAQDLQTLEWLETEFREDDAKIVHPWIVTINGGSGRIRYSKSAADLAAVHLLDECEPGAVEGGELVDYGSDGASASFGDRRVRIHSDFVTVDPLDLDKSEDHWNARKFIALRGIRRPRQNIHGRTFATLKPADAYDVDDLPMLREELIFAKKLEISAMQRILVDDRVADDVRTADHKKYLELKHNADSLYYDSPQRSDWKAIKDHIHAVDMLVIELTDRARKTFPYW